MAKPRGDPTAQVFTPCGLGPFCRLTQYRIVEVPDFDRVLGAQHLLDRFIHDKDP